MFNLKRHIRRIALRLYYRKLWVRIALILLTMVTIPVVLLGSLLINTSQAAMRNSVLNNHKQMIARVAEELGLFIERPRDILTAAAAILSVNFPAAWKQETILVELVLNEPSFMRASTVSLLGEELASSRLGEGLRWDYPNEALEEASKGRAYISRVKVFNNHTPFVTMSVPIKKMGKIVGALISEVNIRGLWEIVDSIQIGNTGRAFLVSADGTLIAHQDKKRVLKNENLKNEKEVISVLAGKTEAVELENKADGKVISSYAPILELGWGVILNQKQEEAYLFSRVMKAQSWIIIILSELAAILVSIFMGRALARPIRNLAVKIKKVAINNLDHKIKMVVRDDIGELIRSFNEMVKKLKKAKEKERLSAVGEAVTCITHELKNSLVSIKSFVQLFPQLHKDQKFVDKFNKLIPEEIANMENMFKELADFSTNFELRMSKVNIKSVIDDVLERLKQEFLSKKIEVSCNARNNGFYVKADFDRLRQVFMNLFINSINAMPEGGSLMVSVDSESVIDSGSSAQLHIKIKDTGAGIPKETLGKIFEPFHTTKSGGMGLGLTISRKIIKQHGGDIDVESCVGRGTTFIVKLPFTHR